MSHVSASCAIITLFFLLLLSSDHYRPAAALYRWTHWHISVCTNGGRHHCSCAGSQVRLLFINFVCFTLYLSFTPHLSSTQVYITLYIRCVFLIQVCWYLLFLIRAYPVLMLPSYLLTHAMDIDCGFRTASNKTRICKVCCTYCEYFMLTGFLEKLCLFLLWAFSFHYKLYPVHDCVCDK